MSTLKTTKSGQVPCKMLVSEAGLGLRKDEIRGFDVETAQRLIEGKKAVAVDPVDEAPAKPAAKV